MEDNLLMLGHYAGTYMGAAMLYLAEGDQASAEESRTELIEKLEGLKKHPTIEKCLRCLRATQWDSPNKVNSFGKQYDALNLEEIEERVRELFGK